MIPDLDIYRAANVLVKHHGQDAPIEAAAGRTPCSIKATWTAILDHTSLYGS